MSTQKWSQPCKQGENQYVIHYSPQLLPNGKYASKLLIAHHFGSGVEEQSIGIKNNPEFITELEAANYGLKAGLEWVRDNG